MKSAILLVFVCVLGLALLPGCEKSPSAGSTPASAAKQSAATPDPANPATAESDGPPAGEKLCFACKGKGTVKCMAPGCVNGQADCPGPCLKLDRGAWVHLDVPGHPPTDIWQKFTQPDGSYSAYNQNHVGHVIVMQNGAAVDTGPCKICGGTGKVPCRICKGTGQQVCPICNGKKYIPETWTPTNNPWFDSQPDVLRLADGRIFLGKVVSTIGTDLTIKTRDGKWVQINSTNLVPKSPSVLDGTSK
jgi:hypothetical protein